MLWGEGVDHVTGRDLAALRVEPKVPRYNGRLEWSVMEVYNEAMRTVGAESGVLVIDLAHSMPKSSRYFFDDLHYTAEGAAQVGAIVSKSLIPDLAWRFPEFAAGETTHSATPATGNRPAAKRSRVL